MTIKAKRPGQAYEAYGGRVPLTTNRVNAAQEAHRDNMSDDDYGDALAAAKKAT